MKLDGIPQKPTVSIVLLAWNCERYVAEAVDSALEQDYDGPLEIVASDDASSDRSLGVLQERVESYRGPRRIFVSRRTANTGSKSAHLNEVLPTCRGELIVSFDGDDVSKRSRVSRLVERFTRDAEIQAVYSSYVTTDEQGRASGRTHVPHPPDAMESARWFARVDAYAAGATLAFRRSVFETFGSLDPAVNEDIVLPFRASLLGRVDFIAEPLVRLRRRPDSFTADWQRFSSLERYRDRMRAGIAAAGRARRSRLADLAVATALMPRQAKRWHEIRRLVERSMSDASRSEGLLSPSLGVRVATLVSLTRSGAYLQEWPQHALLAFAPRLYLRYKRRQQAANRGAAAA